MARNLRQRAVSLFCLVLLLLAVDFVFPLHRAGLGHFQGQQVPPAFSGNADGVAGRDSCLQEPRLAPFLNRAMDINRAESRDLRLLPGIGPTLAARIVADREARGPYDTPRSLLRVHGIGTATLARLEPYICTR